MSQIALVLLWLGTSSSYLYLQSDLDAWSRSRQVTIVPPKSSRLAPLGYDASLVETVEQRLEQARILAASGDEAVALNALGEVDAVLGQHAELPQAAWLMAERLRLEAQIQTAYPDRITSARELSRAASALERAPEGTPRLPIRGLGPHDELYVDGRPEVGDVALAPGKHHVRVVRGGVPVWASWLTLPETITVIDLPVPRPDPCTREDLAGARVVDGRVVVTPPVACPSWAVARPRAGGGVEVASCRHASCGALLPWHRPLGELYVGPPQTVVVERQRWPLFVLAGAGVAALTSIVLWQAGVFDREGEPRYVVRASGPAEANTRSGR